MNGNTYTENNEYPRSGYIASLDGFRAIAVTMVLIAHGRAKMFSAPVLESSFGYLLDQGRFGVMTFFVVSGYLISTLLLRDKLRGKISLGKFALRRALRIIPAFYFYIIVISILNLYNIISVTWANIACAAGFVYNYQYYLIPDGPSHRPLARWFIGHSWTLAVEEQFYLIWPFVMNFLTRAKGASIIIAVTVLCIATRLTLYFGFPNLRPGLANSLIGVADPLLVGSLLAFADVSPRWRTRLLAFTQRIPTFALLLIMPTLDRTAFYWLQYAWSMTIGNVALSVSISLIMFGCLARPNYWLSRLLELSALRYIGRRSYGIYLWQQLFLIPNSDLFIEIFPISFIATFVIAELSFRFIEQPFLRIKERTR